MDWQDIAVGLITALCAVLFLRHFLRPRRRKRPGSGCPEGTARCEDCPLRCGTKPQVGEKKRTGKSGSGGKPRA